ncbi:MAG: Gfo/Idh/MocA family oxidoreductase [Eubacteriales bacterium]|nr:Gfo/Idh/MocA family oxidoreductase [Eubacteriales bacterium]
MTWDRGQAYYDSAAWRGKWTTEGGGALINQAIHSFDLLRWFIGEDIVDMLLTPSSGARFVFYASNCSEVNTPISLTIKCEKGELYLYGNVLTIKSPNGVTTEDYTSGIVFTALPA